MVNREELKEISGKQQERYLQKQNQSQPAKNMDTRDKNDASPSFPSSEINKRFDDPKKSTTEHISEVCISCINKSMEGLSTQMHIAMEKLSVSIKRELITSLKPELIASLKSELTESIKSELIASFRPKWTDVMERLQHVQETLDQKEDDESKYIYGDPKPVIDLILIAAKKAYQELVKTQQTNSQKLIQEIDPIYKRLLSFTPKSYSSTLSKIREYLSGIIGDESTEADWVRNIVDMDFPVFLQKRIAQNIAIDTSDDTFDYENILTDYINHVCKSIMAYYRDKLHGCSHDNREVVQRQLEEFGIIDVLDMVHSGPDRLTRADEELRDMILAFIEWEMIPIQLNVDKVDVRIHDIVGTHKVQEPDLHGRITEVVKEGYKRSSGEWVRKPVVRHGAFF